MGVRVVIAQGGAAVAEGRFTAMSVNLWNTQRWPAREAPLRRLFERSPDVLAVQELRPQLATVIEEVLPHHRRVVGEERGWTHEGNVWWDERTFTHIGHGAAPFGAIERDRRVFWVRLAHIVTGQVVVVASVHLTWLGGSDELETGTNPRLAQTREVIRALDDVAHDGACLVMGDLNDAVVPARVLRAAGFEEAWGALDVMPSATFPAFPLGTDGTRRPPLLPPSTLDWQFHRGAVRPLMTEVIEQPYRGIAPSDHRPLMTLYVLTGAPAPGSRT